MRYTEEIEKPSRNDTKLKVTTETKPPLAKKLRLRIWGYTNDEYLYMLREGELMLKYKTYTIKALDDVFNKMRKGHARANLKRGGWHLGGHRKEQRGGFLPILGAIAKPLLLSAATGIGGYALKKKL